MLDTIRPVETPEGIELHLRVAGPLPRALALGFDFFIRYLAFLVLMMGLAYLGLFGIGVILLALFLIEWFYPVLFEVLWQGATPGKRMLGLQVVHDDGTPVGWTASIVRNLVRFVDFLPFTYGVGLVSCLVHRDGKRLGDIAAGTLVVYAEGHERAAAPIEAEALAPPVPLTPTEARAVIDFAERAPRLTMERVEELAAVAEPLAGASGWNAAQRLFGMARWMRGAP